MNDAPLHVLHVEDDDNDAFLLLSTLRAAGVPARIERVTTSAEGLDRMLSGSFDLHVVDERLPDGSGSELISRARAAGIVNPIILMTGVGGRQADDAALAAGASDFFPKSDLSPDRIRRCFRYAMRAHTLAQRLREHARALEADSLLVVGENGRILFATAAARELFGRPLTELEGSMLGLDLSGDDGLIEVVRNDGSTRKTWVRTARSTWDAGPATLVWLRELADPPSDQGRPRQQEQESAVSKMAAGIAHDFNNLLGGVIGHLELASQPGAAERDRSRFIESALRTAERAADLTSQLLALARRTQAKLEPLELRGWLVQLKPALAAMMDRPGQLRLELPDRPVTALVDPGGLEQALLNLVGNAGYAIPAEGSVRVVLDQHDGEGRLRLRVVDDGRGMAPEELGSALDPFFTTKPVGEGTGLGLPLARKLVVEMKGTFELGSEPGRGTTATLRLLSAPPDQQEPSRSALPLSSDSSRCQGKILVVDDESPIRSVVRAALESIGYVVVTAQGPAVAIEHFQAEGPFDLVLTDVAMPEMSGFELARRVRELHPGQRVAMMSGYGHRAAAARGEEPTSDPVLSKPFRLAEIRRFVASLLD